MDRFDRWMSRLGEPWGWIVFWLVVGLVVIGLASLLGIHFGGTACYDRAAC